MQTCSCVEPKATECAEHAADALALIVAGGTGERFGDARGKQFVDLCGLPMVAWSIAAFDRAPSVSHIVVVCSPDKRQLMEDDVVSLLTLTKPLTLASSGTTRQDSVRSGLDACKKDATYVCIHDAARPLIEVETIENSLAYLRSHSSLDGIICAAPVTDTLKLVEGNHIVSTPDRTRYWAAQTPQVFKMKTIASAHIEALVDGFVATDDASLIEHLGGTVDVFEPSHANIKVTYPEDISYAEAILAERLLG